MNIILREDVQSLGKAGDTLKVSDGYARNFLIPRGLALEANIRNVKTLEHEKAHIMRKAEKERASAEALAEKLSSVTCTIARKVGEQGKLFGSVGTKDIEESLREKGIEIDKKNIILAEPIKAAGEFSAKVKLTAGVTAEIKITVVESA
jgi:large subunit ribosomal protein L9